jgi:hypothetical protein
MNEARQRRLFMLVRGTLPAIVFIAAIIATLAISTDPPYRDHSHKIELTNSSSDEQCWHGLQEDRLNTFRKGKIYDTCRECNDAGLRISGGRRDHFTCDENWDDKFQVQLYYVASSD